MFCSLWPHFSSKVNPNVITKLPHAKTKENYLSFSCIYWHIGFILLQLLVIQFHQKSTEKIKLITKHLHK